MSVLSTSVGIVSDSTPMPMPDNDIYIYIYNPRSRAPQTPLPATVCCLRPPAFQGRQWVPELSRQLTATKRTPAICLFFSFLLFSFIECVRRTCHIQYHDMALHCLHCFFYCIIMYSSISCDVVFVTTEPTSSVAW